ncbi:hypothetical protein PFISCL1PPCAC_21199, partial [Pristionchus fissidentatus]
LQMSGLPDLVIPFSIDEFSKLADGNRAHTDVVYAKDLSWSLFVRVAESNSTGDKMLDVYLECNFGVDNSGWSCEASVETTLLNSNTADNKVIERKETFCVDRSLLGATFCGAYDTMGWDELIDPEKGFIKYDRISFEVRVFLLKTTGLRKMNLVEFTTPIDGYTSVILVVEGTKLHVSKEFLSIHSRLLLDVQWRFCREE